MKLAWLAACLLFPVPAQEEKPLFTFVHLTDTHIGQDSNKPKLLEQVVRDINGLAPAPAFVIVTGDLTEDGKPAEYAEYKRILGGLKPGIEHHACPGNHEVTVGRWADFEKSIGPLYKSFVHQNCLFLLTNGTRDEQKYFENGAVDDAQLAWIKEQLETSTSNAHVFMANHYPLCEAFGLYYVMGPGKNGDVLRKLAKDHKVTAWLGGHRHFDALHHDGVVSHISSGWMAGYGKSAPPGYRVNEVYPDRVISRRVMFSKDAARFKIDGLDYTLPNPRAVKK